MKKLLLFIILFLITSISYSQSKEIIYLDENFKEIKEIEFQKKVRTDFFFQMKTSNDTLIIKKLKFRELYGKLSLKNKHQLNKLFHKRHKIDTTKVWIIHYKDFLPDVSRMRKKSGYIFLDSMGNELSEILSWDQYRKSELRENGNRHIKKYVTSYDDYKTVIKIDKQCLGNLRNIELLHFYGVNLGYPIKKDNFNWLKDSGQLLNRLFTIGMEMYKIIVLHPDGNFYAITYSDSLDRQKERVKYRSFLRSKKKWLREYKQLN